MSVDPEKAIEQLAEYRKDSQQKKDSAKDKKHDIGPMTKKIRDFYIRYHWINAIFLSMLFFTSLIGMFTASLAPIWWFFILIFNGFLLRQLFVTIERLDESEGRFTTFDDVFVVLLLMVSVFELSIVLDIDLTSFIILHVALVIIWSGQIFFINYRKPDLSYVPPMKDAVIEESEKTFTESLIEYFTPKRIIVLVIGLVLAIVISLPTF